MDKVYSALLAKYTEVTCVRVDADAMEDLAERYDVQSVPTFLFLDKTSAVLGKVAGANPPALAAMFASVAAKAAAAASSAAAAPAPAATATDATADQSVLDARLRTLTHAARVMVFIKGSPQEPKCKFSRQLVTILEQHKVVFASFDILSDPAVRAGIKVFSNWPTFPQIYVSGTLIGGLDIVKEHVDDGDLLEILGETAASIALAPSLPAASGAGALDARLAALVKRAPVMLFMKGDRDEPKCGFSRRIVELLDSKGFVYETFDILSDPDVRQGLKAFSKWPTYPQLYVKGELVGGLDIAQEMADDGELADLKP